jgi:hypothetical protein
MITMVGIELGSVLFVGSGYHMQCKCVKTSQ